MLRPKTYSVLERAVEEAVAYGYRRAHKHNDGPDEALLCNAITEAVLSGILEWFDIVEKDVEE